MLAIGIILLIYWYVSSKLYTFNRLTCFFRKKYILNWIELVICLRILKIPSCNGMIKLLSHLKLISVLLVKQFQEAKRHSISVQQSFEKLIL